MTGGDLKSWIVAIFLFTVPPAFVLAALRALLACQDKTEGTRASAVQNFFAGIVSFYAFFVFLRWSDQRDIGYLLIQPIPFAAAASAYALLIIALAKGLERTIRPKCSAICTEFYLLLFGAIALFFYDFSADGKGLLRRMLLNDEVASVARPARGADATPRTVGYYTRLAILEQQYPEINPDHPHFNPVLTEWVKTRMMLLRERGASPEDALNIAVSEAFPSK